MDAANDTSQWLELSGLPAELNKLRMNGWLVFQKIVELDCRRNRHPGMVEISLGELAARCGLEWEKLAAVIEVLAKKKYLACFLPDNPDEPGLFQVRAPLRTPLTADQVAETTTDPLLRDVTTYRYLTPPAEDDELTRRFQRVVDLYLNTLSQNMTSSIVDQIEVLTRRFPYEAIEKAMQRAAKHEIRTIGWVGKELIRDESRKKQKPAP